MSQQLQDDSIILAGSHVYWGGWAGNSFWDILGSRVTPPTAEEMATWANCIRDTNPPTLSAVQVSRLSSLSPWYMKVNAVVSRDISVSWFRSLIESRAKACFGGLSITSQGVGVDWAPSPTINMGSDTIIAQTGDASAAGGTIDTTGSSLPCWLSLDCLSQQFGVDPTTVAIIGAGALLLLVVAIKR